jgi:hypothetical protein
MLIFSEFIFDRADTVAGFLKMASVRRIGLLVRRTFIDTGRRLSRSTRRWINV